jgi:hypothetical protein
MIQYRHFKIVIFNIKQPITVDMDDDIPERVESASDRERAQFEYDETFSHPEEGRYRWVRQDPFAAVNVRRNGGDYAVYRDATAVKPGDNGFTSATEAIERAVELMRSIDERRNPQSFKSLPYGYGDLVLVEWSEEGSETTIFAGVVYSIWASASLVGPGVTVVPLRSGGDTVADPATGERPTTYYSGWEVSAECCTPLAGDWEGTKGKAYAVYDVRYRAFIATSQGHYLHPTRQAAEAHRQYLYEQSPVPLLVVEFDERPESHKDALEKLSFSRRSMGSETQGVTCQ